MNDTLSIEVALSGCKHPFVESYIERINEAIQWAKKDSISLPIEAIYQRLLKFMIELDIDHTDIRKIK